MEETTFLLPVDGVVGRVEVEDELLGPFVVGLEEALHHPVGDFIGSVEDVQVLSAVV